MSVSFDGASISAALQALPSAMDTSDDRTLRLVPGVCFSDGEQVQVFARISADRSHVILSDSGTIHARAAMYGVDITTGAASKHLDEVRGDFNLRVHADRFYVQVPLDCLAEEAAHLAGALVSLDSARLAYSATQEKFSKSLEKWLQTTLDSEVETNKKIETRFGDTVSISAAVPSPRGEILIQAAGGKNATTLRSSSEHAFFVLSSLSPTEHPIRNRLIVLESTLYDRKKDINRRPVVSETMRKLTKRLTEVAYVSAFDAASHIASFMEDPHGSERDLVTVSLGQSSLDLPAI
ncbi:DUF1828 domain-containing protein [Glutamicibacter soli]|uniref:DUF1828 domain-containing protein n=1 Tax=Glutamicibacter soli TaxID=453836 RepID=A0A6L9G1Q9_9MICC|nr:DUF1828 domain-containing protein [Glutamicibacter soli]NAZ14815.1 DUF1828 domain-containing protein [Glutamicibacter soli]